MFIYGSCVSRDTQPHLGEGWTSTKYIARQGMISAANRPAEIVGDSALTSKFQNECLQGDIKSSLFTEIDKHAESTDIFVLDLVDERRGVYEVGDRTYITDSWELGESKLLQKLDAQPRRIAFGTDEHFDLWRKAADAVMVKLATTGRPVIVLAPEWAERADDGQKNLQIRGILASQFNADYKRYLEHLRSYGVTVFTAGQDVAVAAAEHQWGLAPYHYVKPVYQQMQEAIKQAHARVASR